MMQKWFRSPYFAWVDIRDIQYRSILKASQFFKKNLLKFFFFIILRRKCLKKLIKLDRRLFPIFLFFISFNLHVFVAIWHFSELYRRLFPIFLFFIRLWNIIVIHWKFLFYKSKNFNSSHLNEIANRIKSAMETSCGNIYSTFKKHYFKQRVRIIIFYDCWFFIWIKIY
jgi:hypothetical protein